MSGGRGGRQRGRYAVFTHRVTVPGAVRVCDRMRAVARLRRVLLGVQVRRPHSLHRTAGTLQILQKMYNKMRGGERMPPPH